MSRNGVLGCPSPSDVSVWGAGEEQPLGSAPQRCVGWLRQCPPLHHHFFLPDIHLVPIHSLFGKNGCFIGSVYAGNRAVSSPPRLTGVPISGVSLEVWPQEGQVMEGHRLVLHCSVATGTGSISFSWHREGSAEVLGRDSRYEIPSTQQSDNGQYYCMASNGDSPAQSLKVQVTVVGEQHDIVAWSGLTWVLAPQGWC